MHLLVAFIRLGEQFAQPIGRRSHIGGDRRSGAATESPGVRYGKCAPVRPFGLRPLSLQHPVLDDTASVMFRGSANRETEMGPRLSFSIIARRLGSPRA